MGYAIPNGSKVRAAFPTATPIAFTGITNGASIGFTVSAVSGITVGDVVFVKSPSAVLNGMVLVVKTATGTTVTCDGLDSSDVNDFPAGTTGSLTPVKAADWNEIPLITTVAVAGGEQQTQSVQFLEAEKAININTVKSALSQTFTLAHDASDAVRAKLIAADNKGDIIPVWFYQKRAKENRYYSAQVSIQRLPATEVNNIETVNLTFALQNDVTYYTVKP